MRRRRDPSYEAREHALFLKQLQEVDKADLLDRKAATASFANAMAVAPTLVAERVGWLLNGSYGKGSYDAAQRVLHSPRMNRVAWLGSMVGALEWQSPQRATAAAWNKLTAAQKAALHKAIEREIQEALKVE